MLTATKKKVKSIMEMEILHELAPQVSPQINMPISKSTLRDQIVDLDIAIKSSLDHLESAHKSLQKLNEVS